MKKSFSIVTLLLTVMFIATSCGSPYKKRKGCKGNGSWYGNRNLGAVDQKAIKADVYRLETMEMTASVD